MIVRSRLGERLLEGVEYEQSEVKRKDVARLAGIKRKNAEKNFEGILAGLTDGPEADAAPSNLCKHPGILS